MLVLCAVLSAVLAISFRTTLSVNAANIEPELSRRQTRCFSCPATDLAFFPLTQNSGFTSSALVCYYPSVSHCEYSSTNGTLIQDLDSSLCPTTASCGTGSQCSCPTADRGQFTLGAGSGAHGSILFCTYPTTSELSNTTYFCNYSPTDGSLTTDSDFNLCPSSALPSTSTTCTTPTSIRPTSATPTSPITRTTSLTPASASASTTTTTTRSKSKTALAVGATVGTIAFLALCAVAFLLIRRRTTNKTPPTTTTGPLLPNPYTQQQPTMMSTIAPLFTHPGSAGAGANAGGSIPPSPPSSWPSGQGYNSSSATPATGTGTTPSYTAYTGYTGYPVVQQNGVVAPTPMSMGPGQQMYRPPLPEL